MVLSRKFLRFFSGLIGRSYIQITNTRSANQNSLFFVSPTHLVWNREKRPSKKFGMLKQAGAEGLNEMLGMHSEEVEQFLLKKAGVLSEKADAVMTGNGR